jgi:hypothetical protein
MNEQKKWIDVSCEQMCNNLCLDLRMNKAPKEFRLLARLSLEDGIHRDRLRANMTMKSIRALRKMRKLGCVFAKTYHQIIAFIERIVGLKIKHTELRRKKIDECKVKLDTYIKQDDFSSILKFIHVQLICSDVTKKVVFHEGINKLVSKHILGGQGCLMNERLERSKSLAPYNAAPTAVKTVKKTQLDKGYITDIGTRASSKQEISRQPNINATEIHTSKKDEYKKSLICVELEAIENKITKLDRQKQGLKNPALKRVKAALAKLKYKHNGLSKELVKLN